MARSVFLFCISYFVFRPTVWIDLRPFLVGDKVQNTKFDIFFWWYLAQLCLADLPDKFSRLFCLGRTWQSWKNKKMDFHFLFCSPQGTIKRGKVNKNSNFVLCFCTLTRNALSWVVTKTQQVYEKLKINKITNYNENRINSLLQKNNNLQISLSTIIVIRKCRWRRHICWWCTCRYSS